MSNEKYAVAENCTASLRLVSALRKSAVVQKFRDMCYLIIGIVLPRSS